MADKVAIVTGAGRGIGQAVALALAERGFHLTLAARSAGRLDYVRQAVTRHQVQALAAPTDVTEPAEVQAMVDATMDAFGRVDLLVNVAGVAVYKEDIETFSAEEFNETFNVNVRGVFLTTRAVWPIMKQQADGGDVVNISSMSARDPFAGYAVYGASKAAVNVLTESLAKVGRSANIRLYAVCPGAVETPLLRRTFPEFPKEKCLAPAEVAEVVCWCATPPARPCSGQAMWLSRQ